MSWFSLRWKTPKTSRFAVMAILTDIWSSDARTIQSMRWVARILSIAWSYWAAFWTLFVLAHFYEDASLGLTVSIGIAESVVILLLLGGPIIASVWQMEKLGGRVLQMVGGLLTALVVVVHFVARTIPFSETWSIAAFLTAVLPLVSGLLFVECHRRSPARS